jgi:hypothetical protein
MTVRIRRAFLEFGLKSSSGREEAMRKSLIARPVNAGAGDRGEIR